MGYGLWIDRRDRLAWAKGTHEYRPMGAAVVAITDQFRPRDFRSMRRVPPHLGNCFAGFFGSLEDVNEHLRARRTRRPPRLRPTPSHVR